MKKIVALLIVLAFALPLFAGGGGGQQAAGPARNRPTDHVVVGMGGQPASLDPAGSNDQPSSQVNRQIYNTLVDLDDNMAPVPSLAERWVWEDPTRLRMYLRRGVRFHNGDELRASDVKFTLDRAAVSPHIAHITGMIERVDVINDYEILITLDNPFVPFLAHLGHPATSIVNERAVRQYGDDYGRNPVGTGPMRFVNWVTGASIDLVRFDDYWAGPARVRNITFNFIIDPTTRLIALETGEIDLMYGVSQSDVSRVQNDPNMVMIQTPGLGTDYIGFNFQKPPLDDARVRQAINYAIDMDAVMRAAYFGVNPPANGPISDLVWASAANTLAPFTYNQARARQLLTEAGYPNGFSTTLVTNEGNNVRLDVAEIVQNMLAQVGIRMDIQLMEWGAYLDYTSAGNHDMFILGWVTVTGDPDYGLSALFHSDNFGAAGNRTFYANPRLDDLLDQGRRETNPTRREQIYMEAQQIIRDDTPWIWTAVGVNLNASHPSLRGFEPIPAGHHQLWSIYFE